MNMSLGELNINGVSIGGNTHPDDLIGNPDFRAWSSDKGTIEIFTSDVVSMEEYTFKVKIYFQDKRIKKIELTPINLEIEDPGYPDKRYQEAKKKVADSFLRANLGTPSIENEAILSYDFEWGSVTSISYLSGRNEYTGGFILIEYNRNTCLQETNEGIERQL